MAGSLQVKVAAVIPHWSRRGTKIEPEVAEGFIGHLPERHRHHLFTDQLVGIVRSVDRLEFAFTAKHTKWFTGFSAWSSASK